MALRAVLLDLDETLIPEDEPLAAAYLAVVRAIHGDGAGDAEVSALRAGLRARWERDAPCRDYRARVHVSASDGLIAEFTGDDPALAAIRGYLPRFRAQAFAAPPGAGAAPPAAELLALWQRTRVERQTIYPHAPEVLERLRRRVPLGLVTNGASDLQRRKLALAGLDGHFDVVVAACDIGVGKPDPAPFEAALDALGVSAAEAVMVGNDLDRDIAGAASAGLRSLWIQHRAERNGADLHDLRELPERLGL